MNRYHLLHATEFHYDGPVSESYNEVRLRPIHDETQSCLSFRLLTQPVSRGTSYRDAFGNWVHQFNILPEHRHLKIEAESVVLAHDAPQPSPNGMKLSELAGHRAELEEEFLDFVVPTAYVPHLPELDELAEAAQRSCDGTISGFVQAASLLIHEKFSYVKGATHVNSSIKDSLSIGAGVCQDFAHLLLGVVRKLGLPARYVSGYMVPESAASPDAKLQEVIGGYASHAWAEVYLPDSGWIGLDPTLGMPLGLQHVRIAYGRDYGDVAPVRGVYKGHAGQRLSVDVRVRPALDDDGREQISENTASPADSPTIPERAQQPAQQQQ
ncbi:MAG TPA: transglutaminase family protein [Candidatus Dormibacteraeota bacterium]|nr:transglutaminase family protein [Candidatus Dormibacteraeota bacterium]